MTGWNIHPGDRHTPDEFVKFSREKGTSAAHQLRYQAATVLQWE